MSSEEPSKKSALVPILIITNVLSLGGVGAVWFLGPQVTAPAEANEGGEETEDPEAESASGADFGIPVAVGTFTINLADQDGPRYLKVDVKASVSSEKTKEEVEHREPQMRDITISYLSSLTLSDTKGARAKEDIRESLRKRMNNMLQTGEVEDIFFTEFVTQ
ncbi:MAG: flagellar basal body-associated protein FliL [Myxococcota bacterium]